MAKIKKDTSLRKAILQAAITGQLVSNVDGETETGKQLLDRIIEERNAKLLAEWEEALKKNPKAKKPTPVVASEIDEEEIPFEIPENWCWCRFGEIMINRDSERIPLSVSQRELLEKKYDYYGASGVIDKVDKYLFDKDLLLIGEDGANLLTRSTPIAFIASGKYWVNNHAHVLDCDSNNINMNYIKFFINAISLAKYVTGTAQPKMNQEKMNSIPVALPPLSVQNAIVAKLEQVLPLVDVYENAVLEKEELKTALPDKVKKTILQEVITGKLTEDWRIEMLKQVQHDGHTEETGKQLLDRIIEERNAKLLAEWEEAKKKNPKAKKPIPIVASEIPEEEIPFEIPENWCWCRLGDLFNIISARRVHQKDWTMEGVPFYRAREIAKLSEFGFVNNELFISESHFSQLKANGVPLKNDLMVTAVGTLGKTYVVKEADRFYYKDASVICFENRNGINPYYIKNFMDSAFMLEQIKSNSSGTTVGTLTIERTKEYLFPLPPLAEQEKIVEIIEQMLPLCEKLGR